MRVNTSERTPESPYHEGEKEMHQRTGMTEVMEAFGRRAIHPFIPDQHRAFFAQLPFMVVGSVDSNGAPWASIVTGSPGFAASPDEMTLTLTTTIRKDDPLSAAMTVGAQLGLLGIELPTRRRNRLNARVKAWCDDGFTVGVDQSFGNCPQYIQTRSLALNEDVIASEQPSAELFTSLNNQDRKLIETADTFFVASYIKAQDEPAIEGVDVSHRGGRPGFVKINGDILTIPDYTGNFLFNTMGNFLLNPLAGLVFIDFKNGDLLMLTGEVEILWEDSPDIQFFQGAERAWRFKLRRGIRMKSGFPYRAEFGEYSPNTYLTSTWAEAEKIKAAEIKRDAWREYLVTKVEQTSSVIKSFYLAPADGDGLLPFKAGQYLTVRLQPDGDASQIVRTYTVSSAPAEPYYRISVKREPQGQASSYLHDCIKAGDRVQARAPRGDFYIDPNERRPAVLIAGGVGITPMAAMALHVVNEGIRTRHTRPITLLYSAQTTAQRAFYAELKALQSATEGTVRVFSFIDRPTEQEQAGIDFHRSGYISTEALQALLVLDDYDFFLCGPPPFMQALYDTLRGLGVRDVRIKAEAFGPASLKRIPDKGQTAAVVKEAEHAIVRFEKSSFEQRWNAGDPTLLELAEAHGLTPEYGCRSGACGSCAVKLVSGAVAYRTDPAIEVDDDKVLICCAVPAAGSETLEIAL